MRASKVQMLRGLACCFLRMCHAISVTAARRSLAPVLPGGLPMSAGLCSLASRNALPSGHYFFAIFLFHIFFKSAGHTVLRGWWLDAKLQMLSVNVTLGILEPVCLQQRIFRSSWRGRWLPGSSGMRGAAA